MLSNFSGEFVKPIIFLGETLNNSSGTGVSGTSGIFATLIFLFARYIDSGVLDVREIPIITRSAIKTPLGSFPSS